jgi:fibronectin type 3 domain-containing protein
VQTGKRYFYYVTAVDNAGNESQPSEVGSDAIP